MPGFAIKQTRSNRQVRYWQCGVWVNSLNEATVYPDAQEAGYVIALKMLKACEVVSTSKQFVKFTIKPTVSE